MISKADIRYYRPMFNKTTISQLHVHAPCSCVATIKAPKVLSALCEDFYFFNSFKTVAAALEELL